MVAAAAGIVVILFMTALGGSIVPGFVIPAFMNTTALFTYNDWALDGFPKMFRYDDPCAGVPARRWETSRIGVFRHA